MVQTCYEPRPHESEEGERDEGGGPCPSEQRQQRGLGGAEAAVDRERDCPAKVILHHLFMDSHTQKVASHLYLSKAIMALFIADPMPEIPPARAYTSQPISPPRKYCTTELTISHGMLMNIVKSKRTWFIIKMLEGVRRDFVLPERTSLLFRAHVHKPLRHLRAGVFELGMVLQEPKLTFTSNEYFSTFTAWLGYFFNNSQK